MTTTTLARPASRGAGRHRTPEALVFAGATAAALVGLGILTLASVRSISRR